MKNIDIKQLDLLCTLIECQSPAETARRLDITPSAVSQSMARLRETLGDPLLVREGTSYQLTPFGEQAIGSVAEIVSLWKSVQEHTVPFAPGDSDAHLTLACHDAFGEAALGEFYRAAMLEAPWMTIDLNAGGGSSHDIRTLRDGSLDLLAGPAIELPDGAARDLRSETVGQIEISHCCVSARHPRIGRSLSMAQYMAESHFRVATAPVAGEPADPVDAGLWRQGLARRKCSTLNSWALCADMLAHSERLVTVTRSQALALVLANPDIKSVPLPSGYDWPSLPIQMTWHERTSHSPAHRWLRGNLRKSFLASATRNQAQARAFPVPTSVPVSSTQPRARPALPAMALVASNA